MPWSIRHKLQLNLIRQVVPDDQPRNLNLNKENLQFFTNPALCISEFGLFLRDYSLDRCYSLIGKHSTNYIIITTTALTSLMFGALPIIKKL